MKGKALTSAQAGRPERPAEGRGREDCLVLTLGPDLELRRAEGGAQARQLWEAFARHDPALRSLVLEARLAGRPVMGRVTISAEETEQPAEAEAGAEGETPADTPQSFEVCALVEDDGGVRLIARDVSFETNLTRALLRSRELYKDLMFCSADFGWETDAQGRFTYVSPGGALGFTPRELIGKRAAEALGLDEDSINIFETSEPVRGVRCRVRDRDGRSAILMGSAVPVPMRGGARGVARDITAEAEREAAQRLDQARQNLLARIAVDIRSQASPRAVLETVARDAGQALRAESGWVLRQGDRDGEGRLVSGGALAEEARRALDELGAADAKGRAAEGNVAMPVTEDGRTLLLARTSAGRFAAAVAFSRDTAREPWRAFEVELVNGLADQMAIALQQAAMLDELRTLSRTDELTGLRNRRAFLADVETRLRHQRRTGRPAALLFIDFDHFKDVNDTLGHAAGDRVLRAFGRILRETSRAGDIAGRLGGDEFALWLEDTDLAGAKRKAKALLDLVPRLRETAGDAAVPLGLSLGLVMSPAPGAESVHDLLEIADRALYTAKDEGRGRLVIAVPEGEGGESRKGGEGS